MAMTPQQRDRLRRMNLLMAYASFASTKAAAPAAFTPAELFAAGEQGGWYDPSDLTTLYQDAAGTTPVTAVEQPVGLVLDKSKGLVLGSELVTNGTFDGNSSSGWTLPANVTVANNRLEATLAAMNSLTSGTLNVSTTVGKSYRVEFDVISSSGAVRTYFSGTFFDLTNFSGRQSRVLVASSSSDAITFQPRDGTASFTIDNISVRELPGSHLSQSTAAARPVLSARVNALVNTATLSTQSVTTLATNYTLRFDGTGSIALSGTGSGTYSAGSHTVTCTAGTLTLTVTGSVTNADLRPANAGVGLPAYQRVGAAVSATTNPAVTGVPDYDTTGFPLYLAFDGTDDSLASASINFTSTDKMSVFAGVRKLIDTTPYEVIAELSAVYNSNAGSFALFSSAGAGTGRYTVGLNGSKANRYEPQTFAAPVTNVLAVSYDIAGSALADEIKPRFNGVLNQTNASGADAGTGNFGNYPLYIGSRAGTDLRANIRLYSLIVRGAATDAATITSTETWVNSKTKAF